MGGRLRLALATSLATALATFLATALPAALLGVWSVFLVLTGTGPAAAHVSAAPVAVAPAAVPHPVASTQRLTDGGPQSRPAETVRQPAAVENSVRPPGAPPALPGGDAVRYAEPPRGGETAGPRQERAPPSGPYDPRHTRGPPSTRHS
ncbi:hypothetical protein [Streptomyces sp. NPDC006274]|uniref:hypothetical protein n=1 Tax=unclassified Streptomyces TaxID=2593676 RepID=UPI0033BEA0FF